MAETNCGKTCGKKRLCAASKKIVLNVITELLKTYKTEEAVLQCERLTQVSRSTVYRVLKEQKQPEKKFRSQRK